MKEYKPRVVTDIEDVVYTFYALEALKCLMLPSLKEKSGFTPHRHSHERWRERLESFAKEFNSRLARLLYDYTALVVAGEIRHTIQEASHRLIDDEFFARETEWDVDHQTYDGGRDRIGCYQSINRYYSADSILKAGRAIFGPLVDWSQRYGGEKWLAIAEAGLLYGKIPDTAFIDHCVDLSHNGSIYFDKKAGLLWLESNARYIEFLDYKRAISDPRSLLQYYATKSIDLAKLKNSAIALEILDKDFVAPEQGFRWGSWRALEIDETFPEPIKWGKQILSSKLRRNEYFCSDYDTYDEYRERREW